MGKQRTKPNYRRRLLRLTFHPDGAILRICGCSWITPDKSGFRKMARSRPQSQRLKFAAIRDKNGPAGTPDGRRVKTFCHSFKT
jgi:hypothetical protein